jgi:hypothetical protein
VSHEDLPPCAGPGTFARCRAVFCSSQTPLRFEADEESPQRLLNLVPVARPPAVDGSAGESERRKPALLLLAESPLLGFELDEEDAIAANADEVGEPDSERRLSCVW